MAESIDVQADITMTQHKYIQITENYRLDESIEQKRTHIAPGWGSIVFSSLILKGTNGDVK